MKTFFVEFFKQLLPFEFALLLITWVQSRTLSDMLSLSVQGAAVLITLIFTLVQAIIKHYKARKKTTIKEKTK